MSRTVIRCLEYMQIHDAFLRFNFVSKIPQIVRVLIGAIATSVPWDRGSYLISLVLLILFLSLAQKEEMY